MRSNITDHCVQKGQVHSVLDDIKGVGPKRRKELMKYFKDLGQIKTATVTELLKCSWHESKYCRVYLWVFSRFQAVMKYVKIEKETDNQGCRKRERLWIKEHRVSVYDMVKELNLKEVTPEINSKEFYIEQAEINRPALQLAGFFENFAQNRVQIIGKAEHLFIEEVEKMLKMRKYL